MFDILIILLLSFVPMFLYSAILWWFDRYEKEPLIFVIGAFIWGAIPAVILALIMQILLDIPIVALSPDNFTYDMLGGSLVAPLTEEFVKALAVIAMVVVLRREIHSPLDGLIYGGLAGFGFAAVENLLYLGSAYTSGGLGSAIGLAFLRAGVFGLNHAMYTGFTGLGAALALEVKNNWLKPIPVLIGFGMALLTHALHNALATIAGYTGNPLSILGAIFADWSGVAVLLVVIGWTFFLERKRIKAYGEHLARAGVITAQESAVFYSLWRRGLNRAQVLLDGNFVGWWQVGRYYHHVTKAAFTFHRQKQGDKRAPQNLARLEQKVAQLRGLLTSANVTLR